MGGLHEPYSPIERCTGSLKLKGYLGKTETGMGKIEFVICHPLGIRRQTVLHTERLQQTLLLQGT